MKQIVLLISLIAATTLNAYDYKSPRVKQVKSKVLEQIIKNKPNIDKVLAKRLALSIERYAKVYKADPHRAAAIAMQESGYRNIATIKHGNQFDVGMFQINIRTIKEYGFNKKKLIKDIDYAVESYFKVVTDKKKVCKYLKEDAWSCYHSKTKHLRTKYKSLVNRFYIKKGYNEKIANN
jgi:hypothetical protein